MFSKCLCNYTFIPYSGICRPKKIPFSHFFVSAIFQKQNGFPVYTVTIMATILNNRSYFLIRKWHNVISQCQNAIMSWKSLPIFPHWNFVDCSISLCSSPHKAKDFKWFYKVILFTILIMSLDLYRITVLTHQHSSVERHSNFYREHFTSIQKLVCRLTSRNRMISDI